MSLFMIWSELHEGKTSERLSEWVVSESRHKYFNELLQALASPRGISEIAYLLGALKSFLRLHIRGRHYPPPIKIEILDLDSSKGSNGDNLMARLGHVIWSFWSAALTQGDEDTWKELLG